MDKLSREEKWKLARNPTPEMLEQAKRWQEENAEAIKSSNEYIEKNGLPLRKYRAWPRKPD